ncbi:MAG TPA: MarR family transcriptional regulator, partial [Tepidisphaeraceae bacterium]|nr:MarR family transcriptional regulator [Tepidisphaeraceae bacterium]
MSAARPDETLEERVERPWRSNDGIYEFLRAIWKLDHDLQRVSRRMEAILGLTGPQRLCLLHIGRRPSIKPSELANVLHLDRGTITGILSRLERSRLVSRDRNPDDARSFHFTLTSKGRAINRRRGSTIESAVRRALSRVSSHDVEAARRLLATVSDELHAIANSEVRGRR